MKLDKILPIAEKYKETLEPYCKRIEIAGSVRRKKPECRDIELLIIRDPEKLEELKSIVGEWKKIRGSITGRYTQVQPEDIKLDIFIAVDDGSNYANILLIRTGNAKFSRYMMGIRLRDYGYRHRNGFIWRENNKVICNSENDIFKLVGMEYIEPEDREY